MSADEDTELRDLVAQTLETNGVLGKIRAQLRASVFLALEEQESIQNKTPFQNHDLKKFLSTNEGRLVTGLVREYLKFFRLDYTLAVFDPESGYGEDVDERGELAREFNILESEETNKTPLLAEVLKTGTSSRGRQSSFEDEMDGAKTQDLSAKQIAEARQKFNHYDKDKSGTIEKDELRDLFVDMFPTFHRNMLDRYVNDEFRASDKDFSNAIEFEEFLDMYKRLFVLCKSVVSHDVSDITLHSPRRLQSKIPSPLKKNLANNQSNSRETSFLSAAEGGDKSTEDPVVQSRKTTIHSTDKVTIVDTGVDFNQSMETDVAIDPLAFKRPEAEGAEKVESPANISEGSEMHSSAKDKSQHLKKSSHQSQERDFKQAEQGDETEDDITEEIEEEIEVEELKEGEEVKSKESLLHIEDGLVVMSTEVAGGATVEAKNRKNSDSDGRTSPLKSQNKDQSIELDDDSFFDDPIPKDKKSFKQAGSSSPRALPVSPRGSPRPSQIPRSAGSDKNSKAPSKDKPSSIPKPASTTGQSSLAGLPSLEQGTAENVPGFGGPKAGSDMEKDIKQIDKNLADLGVDVPEDDYDDDFDSSNISPFGVTPRSARSNHDVKSIEDEEIEEDLSVASDLLHSDNSGVDDLTTDRTVSPEAQSTAFDYVEDVLQP